MKIVSVGLLICAAAAYGCRSEEETSSLEKAVPVKTAAVERRAWSDAIRTSGLLAPLSEMKLSFKIGGIIDQLLVEDGDNVKKEQLLAKLKLDEIQAQVVLARSGFEKARRDFERVQNLHADSVATLEQLQNAETALTVARSQLEIAEFNLEHSTIFAPASGAILKRLAEENELIGPGVPVFILGTSTEGWIVRVGVTDRDVVIISVGDSASVSFDAHPGVLFPAVVRDIAAAPDPANGTYAVKVALENSDYKLKSGFIARVTLHSSQRETKAVIPIESLVEADGDVGYVFAITGDNRAKKMKVSIDSFSDGWIALSAGLEGIDEIITDGSAYLKSGTLIHRVK